MVSRAILVLAVASSRVEGGKAEDWTNGRACSVVCAKAALAFPSKTSTSAKRASGPPHARLNLKDAHEELRLPFGYLGYLVTPSEPLDVQSSITAIQTADVRATSGSEQGAAEGARLQWVRKG